MHVVGTCIDRYLTKATWGRKLHSIGILAVYTKVDGGAHSHSRMNTGLNSDPGYTGVSCCDWIAKARS